MVDDPRTKERLRYNTLNVLFSFEKVGNIETVANLLEIACDCSKKY